MNYLVLKYSLKNIFSSIKQELILYIINYMKLSKSLDIFLITILHFIYLEYFN